MNNTITDILDVLKNCSSFAIAGHTNPDGDAIGACMGLAHILRNAGKSADVYLEPVADTFYCIPGTDTIIDAELCRGRYDAFIALDCGDIDRLPSKVKEVYTSSPLTVNIDHHMSNDYFGMDNYVLDGASSTSEIIFSLVKDDFEVTKDAAAALYAGIIYDTGGLRHTSTSPFTMNVVAQLMSKGINFSSIYNEIFNKRSFVEAKLMGLALTKLKTACEGKIVYSFLTKEEISSVNGSSKDVSEIINYIKSVKGASAAVFIYEKGENESKVSMRADEPVNVAEIASSFGGGGHARAAGYTAYSDAESALVPVLKILEDMLK